MTLITLASSKRINTTIPNFLSLLGLTLTPTLNLLALGVGVGVAINPLLLNVRLVLVKSVVPQVRIRSVQGA